MPTHVRHRIIRITLFTTFILLGGHSFATINFEPCYVTGSAGNGNLQAQCATWERPLDPAEPDGPTIELFVTKLASTALQPAADAFTIINGGPGASSVQMMVDLAPVLQAFTRERDVVVIDQRGTGSSAPLICQALTDSTEILDAEQTIALTQDCIDKLPHDPRFFSTTVAVEDLEALRIALQYRQLSVYGVSYGTRVAMQYMRTYPDSLRSVVIDGVVPPTKVLGENVALNSQQTLDGLFDRCRQHPGCDGQFPRLAEDFARLQERLRSDPVALNIQHPVTGVATDVEVGYGHLAVWIRLALYAPATSALIPLIIHEAANADNYLPIAASALRMLHQLNDSMNYGMHNAVVCTEDAPFFSDADVDFERLEKTYLGREMYDTLKTMCSTWPAGVIDKNMKAPLVSSVPTLVLSGEFDPITPPAYGDAVMPGLSRAKHIVAPGQGHGTIAQGCIPRLILEFVESADPASIDGSCVEHLSTFPFFVDLMGPPP
ncbi:MAG: alpha/beta fold hydrolase [bacterium]